MRNRLLTIRHRSHTRHASPHAHLALYGLFISLLAAHTLATRAQTQTAATPAPTSAQASSPAHGSVERERGVEMIRQGDFKGASKVLRDVVRQSKQDADAWYYLGVALSRGDDDKEARKAFEQSLKLRPEFVNAHVGLAHSLIQLNKLHEADRQVAKALALDPRHTEAHYVFGLLGLRHNNFGHALSEAEAALKIDDDYQPALLLKTQALVGLTAQSFLGESERSDPAGTAQKRKDWLEQASASLEKLVSLNPRVPNLTHWREQLEVLGLYAQAGDQKASAARTVLSARDVAQKAVIHTRPEPEYPARARMNGTTGKVRLRMVLGADGMVRHILVLHGLPDGITEAAVAAARKIKFSPAIKDGRPVSTVVTVEYAFNIY